MKRILALVAALLMIAPAAWAQLSHLHPSGELTNAPDGKWVDLTSAATVPAGSGLSPMVADGTLGTDWRATTDGEGCDNSGDCVTAATDNAPMIDAAIDWACANGYRTVKMPPGIFRVGSDSSVSGTSWDGVRMDVATCPEGVALLGSGTDWANNGTLLLNQQNHGGFMIELSDLQGADDQTGGKIYGIWDNGLADTEYVTAISLAGTTPVITLETGGAGAAPDGFSDGDKVFIRGCVGSVELNNKVWTLDNGAANSTEYDYDLLDQWGLVYEPTGQVSAWAGVSAAQTPNTSCTITHVNEHAHFEFGHFAYGSDSFLADLQYSGNPISLDSEESHGIRIKISGGSVHIHDTFVIGIGDEAVDMASNETPLLYENNICNDSPSGCIVQQASTGSVIRNNIFDVTSTWINDLVATATATEPINGNSLAIQIGPLGPTCRRVANMEIYNNTFRGLYRGGIQLRTFSPHFGGDNSGAICSNIENVSIHNNQFIAAPRPGLCNEGAEDCIPLQIRADEGAPIEGVYVENNFFLGPVEIIGSSSKNIVWQNNTHRPIPGTEDEVAVIINAPHTTFKSNDVRDFTRTCLELADALFELEEIVTTVDGSTDWGTVTDDELDLGADHEFVSGDLVVLTGGTLPTGLSASTEYFITEGADSDHFNFSVLPIEDPARVKIELSGSPTGTTTVTVQHTQTAIDVLDNTFACLGNSSDGAEPMIGPQNGIGTLEFTRPGTVSYLNIINNKIYMDPLGFLDDGINISWNAPGINISNNKIYAPKPQNGTRAFGIVTLANAAIIADNFIDGNFGTAAIQFSDGTNPADANGGAQGPPRVEGNIIDNNFEAGGFGIYASTVRGPQINGNTVRHTDNSGIAFLAGADAGGGSISGNHLEEIGAAATSDYGIETICSGCTCINNMKINDNTIDTGGVTNVDGMFLNAICESQLTGNNCVDIASGGNGECIWLWTGSDNNVCWDNMASGGADDNLFICGTTGSGQADGSGCTTTLGVGAGSHCDRNIVTN